MIDCLINWLIKLLDYLVDFVKWLITKDWLIVLLIYWQIDCFCVNWLITYCSAGHIGVRVAHPTALVRAVARVGRDVRTAFVKPAARASSSVSEVSWLAVHALHAADWKITNRMKKIINKLIGMIRSFWKIRSWSDQLSNHILQRRNFDQIILRDLIMLWLFWCQKS